jgi:hypothetical protein
MLLLTTSFSSAVAFLIPPQTELGHTTAMTGAFSLAWCRAINESGVNRFVQSGANGAWTHARLAGDIEIREPKISLDRTPLFIEITERSTKDVSDDANNHARMVTQTNLKEIVRTIDIIGVEWLEAREPS